MSAGYFCNRRINEVLWGDTVWNKDQFLRYNFYFELLVLRLSHRRKFMNNKLGFFWGWQGIRLKILPINYFIDC